MLAKVTMEAMVVSALNSAAARREVWVCAPTQIILSAKVSGVQDLIDVYRALAARLQLSAAPRTDRSRHGCKRRGRLQRRARSFCCREGHRRYHPCFFAYARSPAAIAPRKSAVAQQILQSLGIRQLHPAGPQPAPDAAAPPVPSSRKWPSRFRLTCVSKMPMWEKTAIPGVEE